MFFQDHPTFVWLIFFYFCTFCSVRVMPNKECFNFKVCPRGNSSALHTSQGENGVVHTLECTLKSEPLFAATIFNLMPLPFFSPWAWSVPPMNCVKPNGRRNWEATNFGLGETGFCFGRKHRFIARCCRAN